jgi:hypothetical protein
MITASTPVGSPPFFPGVDVEFQVAATSSAACSAAYANPVTPTSATGGILDVPNVMVISANRVAINVPSFGAAALTSKYNVCVCSARIPGQRR